MGRVGQAVDNAAATLLHVCFPPAADVLKSS